jgi:hypothetical protein
MVIYTGLGDFKSVDEHIDIIRRYKEALPT